MIPGDFITGLVTGGLGIVGSEISARSARDVNDRQIALSQEQMAWQERMSNTAHQREVADLRAAGLNPILSATGGSGASNPLGSVPVLRNPYENLGNVLNNVAANVVSSARAISEMELLSEKARTEKTQQAVNTATAKSLSGRVKIPGFFDAPLSNVVDSVKSMFSRFANSARILMDESQQSLVRKPLG